MDSAALVGSSRSSERNTAAKRIVALEFIIMIWLLVIDTWLRRFCMQVAMLGHEHTTSACSTNRIKRPASATFERRSPVCSANGDAAGVGSCLGSTVVAVKPSRDSSPPRHPRFPERTSPVPAKSFKHARHFGSERVGLEHKRDVREARTQFDLETFCH